MTSEMMAAESKGASKFVSLPLGHTMTFSKIMGSNNTRLSDNYPNDSGVSKFAPIISSEKGEMKYIVLFVSNKMFINII